MPSPTSPFSPPSRRRRCSRIAAGAAVPRRAHSATPTPRRSRSIPLDRVVAVVGDVVDHAVGSARAASSPSSRKARSPDGLARAFNAFARASLNELVDEELLLQKAKELKIEVPDADVEQHGRQAGQGRSAAVRAPTPSTAPSSPKAGLGTPEEYRRFLDRRMRRNELITRTVKKLREDGKIVSANVTDAEVQDAYERNKATLPKREASVTWRQIIIAPKPTAAAKDVARAKAESLLAEIKRAATSSCIAKRESDGSRLARRNGGDLGWNRRGTMVPEFDAGCSRSPPGQLSPVIETAFGYHIIRVDRVQPGEVKARHILIAPKVDSADVVARTLEADSVAAALARRRAVRLARRRSITTSPAARRRRCSRPSRVRSCRPRTSRRSRARRPRTSSSFEIPGNATVPGARSSSRRSPTSRRAATSRSPR